MTELKTLKDIDSIVIENEHANTPSRIIEAYQLRLRAEAIKWYKQIHQRVKSKIHKSEPEDIIKVGQFLEVDGKLSASCAVLCFIKRFFNLSEEDLK